MNKIINWFKQSNRYKHTIAGLLITSLYITLLNLLFNNSDIQSKVSIVSIALISNFTHMCAVEYKDLLYNSKFDWNDIIAGIIPSVILSIIIFIICLLCI